MDNVTLVESQIEDGQKLIAELEQQGFPVTAVFWLKTIDDPQWFLYLAASVVDKRRGVKPYGRIQAIVRQMPQPFWIDPLDVKLIGTTEPLTEAILEMLRRYPGKRPVHYTGDHLGDVSIDGAYIYALPISGDLQPQST